MLVNSVPQIVQHARMRMNTSSKCRCLLAAAGAGAASWRSQRRTSGTNAECFCAYHDAALCAWRSKLLSAPAHAAHLRDNLDVLPAPIVTVEPPQVTTSVHQRLVGLLLFDLKLSAALRYAWGWFLPRYGRRRRCLAAAVRIIYDDVTSRSFTS